MYNIYDDCSIIKQNCTKMFLFSFYSYNSIQYKNSQQLLHSYLHALLRGPCGYALYIDLHRYIKL